MDRQDLQVWMPFEHAVEDQIVQRDRRLQRIADHVIEVETREPLCLGEAVRVNDNEGLELFRLFPEWRKRRIRQLLAGDVGQDLYALELERLDAALKLLRRFLSIRHRHSA